MRYVMLAMTGLLILAAAIPPAYAGTVLVIDTWSYDQYSESGTHTLYIDQDKARLEFQGKGGETHVIYRLDNKDKPVMWLIDPAEESYVELDEKTLKKMKNKMQEAMEMMENYASRLSADERTQMESQYKKQIRQADKMMNYEDRRKKTTYEKVDDDVKFENWTCDEYKGMFKKELYKKVWVADWKEIGIESSDVAVLNGMSEVFKGFSGEMIPFTDSKIKGSDERLNGFPLKAEFYESGNKIVRQEVKEIRKEDLDGTLFELPEGFDKKDPMM